jgi:transposase
MTDQQTHLSSAIEQQKALIEEMKTLESNLSNKRELAIKLQGVIEYLNQIGVKLPKPEEEEETIETEIVEETAD